MNALDFAQYSRISGIDGLEVMSARWVEHSFAPHMHDFYAVSLNYGGRGAFHCRQALRDASPGTCNLIAPAELHTGHATSGEGWMYRKLYIDTPLMTALLQGLDWEKLYSAKKPCNLTRQFLPANIHGAARREHP